MASAEARRIRDAIAAGNSAELKAVLAGLNRPDKATAIRDARSSATDEMNAAVAAQSGAQTVDVSAWTAEIEMLNQLLKDL